MNRRLGLLALVAVLAAGWSGIAAAQWKWRDKSGQLHISDLPPPPHVPEKDVLSRPSAPATKRPASPPPAAAPSAAAAQKPAGDPELEARLRRAEQERTAQQKQEEERQAAARAENCSRAKDNLRTIESGTRLVRHNEKGEREVLDDKQRAEEAQRARNVIAQDCR